MNIPSSSKSGTPLFSLAEARTFLALGIPIFIAQFAMTGMTFVDTVMTGLYSTDVMAAVGMAGSLFASIGILGIGCLNSISPLTAQAVGAGRYHATATSSARA